MCIHEQLDSKAKKLQFVGYQDESTKYRLYDPVTRKITVSRNVIFNECKSDIINDHRSKEIELVIPDIEREIIPDAGNVDDQVEEPRDQQPQQEQVRKLRDRSKIKPPIRYQVNYIEYHEPQTFKDAVSCKDAEFWNQAIKEELHALEKNKT